MAARSRSRLAQHPWESRPAPVPTQPPAPGQRLRGEPEWQTGTRQLAASTRFCSQQTCGEQPVLAGAFILTIPVFFTRAALCACKRCVRARAASWRLYKRPRCALCPRLCGGTRGHPRSRGRAGGSPELARALGSQEPAFSGGPARVLPFPLPQQRCRFWAPFCS